MFHVGRCGSTVLGDMLGQHPEMHWDREIYESALAAWDDNGRIGGLPVQLPGGPLGFLDHRIRMTPRRKSMYGFEVKFYHLRLTGIGLAEYVDALAARGFDHAIVLRRRNNLRKVISSLVARQTKRYHLFGNAQAAKTLITVDVDRVGIDRDSKPLTAYLDDYEQRFAALDGLLAGWQRLDLEYETDILPGPHTAYERASRFLGMEPGTPAVRFARTTPFPMRAIVQNYAELEGALRGTRFAWMLDE